MMNVNVNHNGVANNDIKICIAIAITIRRHLHIRMLFLSYVDGLAKIRLSISKRINIGLYC